MNGPPKKVGPRPGHHSQTGDTDTNPTSSHHEAGQSHSTALVPYTGVATWWRRGRARQRMPALPCSCVDPWIHRCAEPPTSGYELAAAHLLDHGLTPAPNVAALREMWKHGGAQRLDAELIAERWGLAS